MPMQVKYQKLASVRDPVAGPVESNVEVVWRFFREDGVSDN